MHENLPSHPPRQNRDPSDQRLILLTGATGYVGGRLLRAFEQEGRRVRCLTRHPENLNYRVADHTEVVKGDVLDPGSLRAAMQGVHTAYFLVHSMGDTGRFEDLEQAGAEHFRNAATAAGVQRIVYLGGLCREHKGPDAPRLSPHLESRKRVGEILRSGPVTTIELRAAIIIGSGSLSYEMLRYLVQRLPVMITPKWTRKRTQPIAVEDVIDYLIASERVEVSGSTVVEIAAPEPVSYDELMRMQAELRGLRRLIIPVPFLTPRLSSHWLALITPLQARIGRLLIDSVRHDTTRSSDAADHLFPHIQPRGVRDAIQRAMVNEDMAFTQTRWCDAVSSTASRPSWGGVKYGSRLIDYKTRQVPHPPRVAFEPIRRIGGDQGYYYGNWLWRLRGLMDILIGGPGLRRGRRHPRRVGVGETVDFWRVEAFEPERRLLLRAEMRLPGRAWLQFEVQPDGAGGSRVMQTAIFDPLGLLGLAYWYSVWPLHLFVFDGMLDGIVKAADRFAQQRAMKPEPQPPATVGAGNSDQSEG